MASPTVSQFLTAMRSYLGVHEVPDGSNRTRVGVEFGWNGVAWCAETVSVAAQRAGFQRKFWSASTDQWEKEARKGTNGAKWIPAGATPRPGDCPIWDYKRDGTANHISVVESVRSDGKLITLGGNEANRCQRAVRTKYALRGYVRMPFRVIVGGGGLPGVDPNPPVVVPKPPVVVKPPVTLPILGDKMFALFFVQENKIYFSLTPWGLQKLDTAEGYALDQSSTGLTAIVVAKSATMVKMMEGVPRLY